MVNNLYILNCMKIVQIIMICLDMLFVVVMVKQKESRLSKLMLCIAFLGVVNNFGYLLELSAVNVNDAMKAVSVEYLGGAFIVSFVFLFGLSESTALDIFPAFPWLFFKETNIYKKDKKPEKIKELRE